MYPSTLLSGRMGEFHFQRRKGLSPFPRSQARKLARTPKHCSKSFTKTPPTKKKLLACSCFRNLQATCSHAHPIEALANGALTGPLLRGKKRHAVSTLASSNQTGIFRFLSQDPCHRDLPCSTSLPPPQVAPVRSAVGEEPLKLVSPNSTPHGPGDRGGPQLANHGPANR